MGQPSFDILQEYAHPPKSSKPAKIRVWKKTLKRRLGKMSKNRLENTPLPT